MNSSKTVNQRDADNVPPLSQELTPAYWAWVGYVFLYISTVAFILWIFSKTNKEAWKSIASLIGWKEDEQEVHSNKKKQK